MLGIVITIAALLSEKGTVEDRQKMWREVAARRGGAYVPGVYSGGGWATPQVIDVVVNGARVYVDTFHRGEAVNSTVYLRLRAEYVTGAGPAFDVDVPTLVVAGPRVALGGNQAFDEGFVITTDAPQPTSAVWTQAARERMLTYFRGAESRVRCDGRVITMTSRGDDNTPARLEAAIDIMADLALAGRGAPGRR